MGIRVGTSIGKNKLHPGIDEMPLFKPWTTFRKMAGAPPEEQEARYRRQLDEVKEGAIETALLALGEKHPGETLVLLCYEVLGGKSYCHRRWLAGWLIDRFRVDVPELGKHKKDAPSVSPLDSQETLL
jgi:hypothetical protein